MKVDDLEHRKKKNEEERYEILREENIRKEKEYKKLLGEELYEEQQKISNDFFNRWFFYEKLEERLFKEIGKEEYDKLYYEHWELRKHNKKVAEGIAFLLTEEEQNQVVNIIRNSEKYKAILERVKDFRYPGE